MITPSQEYYQALYRIQHSNFPLDWKEIPPLPSNEPIYEIDLNTRTIEAPKSVGVLKDQNAEIIYFRCNRYYDTIDLSETCCVIQFFNAEKKDRFYPVPFYGYVSTDEEEYMLIPWLIDQSVTEIQGSIEFAIRFYQISEDEKTFLFSLNTLPATTKVLRGMNTVVDTNYNFEADKINEILARLDRLQKDYEVYWIDVI